MLVPVLLFLLGLVFLIRGGDLLVDGAVDLAHRFAIPEILIGATVVAIGTTVPEVMVSATSAVEGHSEIAYGNAIGSVICNTALIAALTAAFHPGSVDRNSLTLPMCFFFAASLLYAGAAYFSGSFTRLYGVLFLILFVLYMAVNIISAGKDQEKDSSKEDSPEKISPEENKTSLFQEILMVLAGAVLVAIGANLLVDNGTLIAEAMGVPEKVIALTFVALGTSLPELVTAITSLIKGHSALSLGNVIGANLFNIVLVCGIAITLRPFAIPASSVLFGQNASLVLDLPVMFGVTLLLAVPAFLKKRLYRWQGILLLVIYFSYCILQFAM